MTENSKQKINLRLRLKSAIISATVSPTLNIAALVILFVSVFAGLRLFSVREIHSQVKFVENHRFAESEKPELQNQFTTEIFKGEVYETSVRLRETGAIGMAISLAVFANVSEKRSVPPNLETIWSFILSKSLMPPDLKFENGELSSPTSLFLVRFQSQPFRYEILSSPKQGLESPAILLRFPLNSLDGRTITYFQTVSVNRFDIPAPFAPLEKVVAAGWTIEQWQGELLPKNENLTELLTDEQRLLKEMQTNK
jgi:hypothetical protein